MKYNYKINEANYQKTVLDSIQELNSFRITKKEENPNDENDATNEDKTPKM